MTVLHHDLIGRVRRGLRKPPHVVLVRLASEAAAEADRFMAPWQARTFTESRLLRALECDTLDDLWSRLAARPYFAHTQPVTQAEYDAVCSDDSARIMAAAADALGHRVDLLGSGPLELGDRIDWHKDYKTGKRWECAYVRDIEYNNPELPSDVKTAWEISRLQWLIPAGQAYLLTGDERYAECVRDVVSDWIESNPYAHSVNWACTMEVALRILTFTWLFHTFHASRAWRDDAFRFRFLASLFLHAKFTERHIERSDINGNHFTADAAGLVFAGLFFGRGAAPKRWAAFGWQLLSEELPRQVFADGVDFEASVAYHRLVHELFLLPALYRKALHLPVAGSYENRMAAMARFTAAYTRPDGSAPGWGDADDARALPFGSQDINDHRYLIGLNAVAWNSEELRSAFSGPLDEVFWTFGPAGCQRLSSPGGRPAPCSVAFPDGGFYVMRNAHDHVFVDCGPVGLGGRGGHGHNDCLSFEAVLDGTPLVADCGAYVYTASYAERNRFRSTAYHNTPSIDGQEINRFPRWDYIWLVQYDAAPEVRCWESSAGHDRFRGAHAGYRKLEQPVTPVRSIMLDHASHTLTVSDSFEGEGTHTIEVPLHLAPGIEVQRCAGGAWLTAASGRFLLTWSDPADWTFAIESARVSPSYGVVLPTRRVAWKRTGGLRSLTISISPVTPVTDPRR